MDSLLHDAAKRAAAYLASLKERRVSPSPEALADLRKFATPMPAGPRSPEDVLRDLDAWGSPATVASAGGRFFGFVFGGTVPAAAAASVLATAWDQNAAMQVSSPVGSALEKVCRDWLVDLLSLGAGWDVGFVTAATTANFTGLAAARHALLAREGWDVESRGLFGAPPITVIVGDEVHVSMLKALSLIGFGRDRVVKVPVDNQGRLRPDALPTISGPTIVCLQSGNVNTGAFDPIDAVADRVAGSGAWIHVDAAFGLWAAASPAYRHLMVGAHRVDSIATDAHKWLNVPYDSGIVFVKDPRHLNASMSATAAYLMEGDTRDPHYFVPEMSRRARGVEIWAALSSLGRSGLADLVDRTCAHARRFADGLRAAGYRVLNDVVINQVLVSFGSSEVTRRVVAGIQADGTCWCGGTQWQGQTAMRISVSSWATTVDDVDRSLAAMLRIASRERGA